MIHRFSMNAGEFLVQMLANPAVDKQVRKRRVVYARAGKKKLKADIVTYDGVKPKLLALCIHGGGFVSGRKETRTFLCGEFAKNGFLVFNIDYLLAPKADMRDIFENVGEALRYMKTLAEVYDIPERYCVIGDSAGGHIASLLCGVAEDHRAREYFRIPATPKLAAMVNLCGSFDVRSAYACGFSEIQTFFRAVTHMSEAELLSSRSDLYSPSTYDLSKFPPTFIVNGEKDSLKSEGNRLFDALQNAGVPCEIYTGTGVFAVHDFILFPYFRSSRDGLKACFDFLKRPEILPELMRGE